MIEIRQVQREELDALRRIAIETFVDTFALTNTQENMDAFLREAYSPVQFENESSEKGAVCYMAWDLQDPAGFVRLRLNPEVENYLGKNTVELHRLYVHANHQRKRVGSLLMEKALHYATAGGFEWIWLGVWEHNTKAQSFYLNRGFEKFSEHIFPMGDDLQTDWLMRKKLV